MGTSRELHRLITGYQVSQAVHVAATLGLSDSAGVPEAIAGLTAVLPYNDPGALEEWFARHGQDTAAVIAEPVVLVIVTVSTNRAPGALVAAR